MSVTLFDIADQGGMSHKRLCGANMSALSISKHCILQPSWHILLFQTFIRASHKTERTSTPWSIVATRRLNLGLPDRSLILALYNNLRQRLCSEFTGSDPSNERDDGVKYVSLQSHILSQICRHKCRRSPPWWMYPWKSPFCFKTWAISCEPFNLLFWQ